MMSFFIASFIAGTLSAPHCAMMCGPIGTFAARTTHRGLWRYQIGRAVGYSIAGSTAGLLGQPVVRWLWQSNIALALSWTLAFVLAYAAYSHWPRSPSKKTKTTKTELVQINTPSKEVAKNKPFVIRILTRFPRRPLVLGFCSVLIPCAALWGGIVIAASSASPLVGAMSMLLFSLTSGTGLLASGVLAKFLHRTPKRKRVLSILFAIGAVILIARPFAMRGQGQEAAGPTHCPLHPNGAQ